MNVIKYFYLSAGLHIWKQFFLRKASLPAIMWPQMGHLHLQFSLKNCWWSPETHFLRPAIYFMQCFIKLWMRSVGFLSPETHFLCSVVFFMQCYLKIVDEYLWFSFPGNAFLLPETHSSRAVVFFMQCHVKIVDK